MTVPLRHMPRPCDPTTTTGACPFRLDAAPGEFTAERYERLADTAGRPGAEAPLNAPMFACHHVADTEAGTPQPIACAGWLAVCGQQHLGVRFAVSDGRLDAGAVCPPADVDLFGSYDEMATQQAQGIYRPEQAAVWRERAGHNLPTIAKFGGPLVLRDADVADTERGSCDVQRRPR